MLMNLRSAVIALPQATKALSTARSKLKDLRDDLDSLDKSNKIIKLIAPQVNVHTERLIYEYKRPFVERNEKHQRRKSKIAEFPFKLLRILCIIAAIIYPIIASFLLFKHQKLGYSFFVNHHWEGWFVKDWSSQLVLGLYVAGVMIVVLGGLWGVLSETAVGPLVAAITVPAILIVPGLIAFKLWGATGGWTILALIGTIFASAGIITFFIARVLYAALITVIVAAIILVPPFIFFAIQEKLEEVGTDLKRKVLNNYDFNGDDINLEPLFATEEYKEACKLDALEDSKKMSTYNDAIEAERKSLKIKYKDWITEQNQIIENLNNSINNYQHTIDNCSIHNSYKNVESLNCLLYYFNYDLAETVTQAANLWRNDIKMQQFQNMLKKQHAEVIAGQQQIIAGQQAIRSDIAQYNSDMNRRWAEHQALCQLQHEEKISVLRSLERQQEKISERNNEALSAASRNVADAVNSVQASISSSTNYLGMQMSNVNRTIANK